MFPSEAIAENKKTAGDVKQGTRRLNSVEYETDEEIWWEQEDFAGAIRSGKHRCERQSLFQLTSTAFHSSTVKSTLILHFPTTNNVLLCSDCCIIEPRMIDLSRETWGDVAVTRDSWSMAYSPPMPCDVSLICFWLVPGSAPKFHMSCSMQKTEVHSCNAGREETSVTEEYASDFDDYNTEEEQEMVATGLEKQLSSSHDGISLVFGFCFPNRE